MTTSLLKKNFVHSIFLEQVNLNFRYLLRESLDYTSVIDHRRCEISLPSRSKYIYIYIFSNLKQERSFKLTSQVKLNLVKQKMSGNQGKIHQDQEDKLPFNGENGNNSLRDQDDLVTSQQEQVNNKKACSKIPRKLQPPTSPPGPR